MRPRYLLPLIVLAVLGACRSAEGEGTDGPTPAFDKIAADETVRFTGTEPFWGGTIAGETATYSTPENVAGSSFPVKRFAGMNGVSFSGSIDGISFDLMITPGDCSDGMSDRSYPYVATLMLGNEKREGCAWTDSQPFTGIATP